MIFLGEVTLDQPTTLKALRKVFTKYSSSSEGSQVPLGFVLTGNFSSQPSLAGSGVGSIEYKDLFNQLAALLADFPSLLRNSTFTFIPGDNDAWMSSSTGGSSNPIPRGNVPEVFTSRIRRVFANANNEGRKQGDDVESGEAVWTTNPARVSLFGPRHEVVVFRDNVQGRMRRNAIRVGQATRQDRAQQPQDSMQNQGRDPDLSMSGTMPSADHQSSVITGTEETTSVEPQSAESFRTHLAKKLILSLLPQSTLSPFPLQTRPVHWDYGSCALSLFPLPTTLVLVDSDMEPYTLTYEGCHVFNPGTLVDGGGKGTKVRWIEYDCYTKRGTTREQWLD